MKTQQASPFHRSDFTPNEPPSPSRKRRAVALRDDRRKLIWSIGVALWIIAMVAAIVAMMNGDGGVSTDGENVATPLVLSVGAGGASASCLPFSVEILATMPQAFTGTVTSVEADAITIAVDRWYAGGTASLVRLETIGDAQALLGGFSYDVGSSYLLTASDGTLSYCGYSGPSTPELEASFERAFLG